MDNFIGLLGYMGLTGGFIICLAIVILSGLSHFRRFSGWNGLIPILVHLQTSLLAIAVFSLAILLLAGAYQYEQVFMAIEDLMRTGERIGGLWSGQAASLLFWSFIMSMGISLSIMLGKNIDSEKQRTTVIFILEFTLVFFLAPDIFVSNPFVKLFRLPSGEIFTSFFAPPDADLLIPMDGQGMNPSLRHIAMLLHPPTLYLGLIGLFLPYAFALSALLHRDRTQIWIQRLFPITLIATVFLTLGMLLGSWWAYTILGWGGYWGWDAVEISGLLPWLLSFGLLHAMRLTLQKKSMDGWVNAFAFAIVVLILIGILITRSGILESVHSYASGPMGPILTTLILIHLGLILIAVMRNYRQMRLTRNNLSGTLTMHLYRWFFWCIIGLVVIYLFGQTLPLTSQWVLREKLVFKPQDYEHISAPLLFMLLMLSALCANSSYFETKRRLFWRIIIIVGILSFIFPFAALSYAPFSISILTGFWAAGFLLLSWMYAFIRHIIIPIFQRKPTTLWSNRLGMVLIHLGLAVMAIGIVGVETMATDDSLVLLPDSSSSLNGYTITYKQDSSDLIESGNPTYTAAIGFSQAGKTQAMFAPAVTHYIKTGDFYVIPAIRPGFLQDIQVVLEKFPASPTSPINLHISFFPLMSWIWAGGAMMAFGGFLPIFFQPAIRKK